MKAKIVKLQDHRDGKAVPSEGAITDRQKEGQRLLLEVLIGLINRAGYSKEEILFLAAPFAFPPGSDELAHWADCVEFYFENSPVYQAFIKSVKGGQNG